MTIPVNGMQYMYSRIPRCRCRGLILGKYQAVRAWFEESVRISKGAKVEFFACLANAAFDNIEEDQRRVRIQSALETVLEEIHPDDKATGLTPADAAEVSK